MIHGLAQGQFLDDKRFWPIYARAEALDVPIYLHPGMPHAAVIDAYYKEYAKDFPILLRAAWGFTVETATLGVRLVLSGVFEKHPEAEDSSSAISARACRSCSGASTTGSRGRAEAGRKFRDIFCDAFLRHDQRLLLRPGAAAASRAGHRPHPVLGRLSVRGERARARMAHPLPMCDEDKAKIASGNAKRLLKI